MDPRIAFLNEVVEEKIYMERPEEFEQFSRDTHVCRLKSVVYGLKPAPRAWYTLIDSYLRGLSFTKNWAWCSTDRKSTSGGVFNIGSTVVSWYSRKHISIALSSTEAEYMVASLVAFEAIWKKKLLVGLFKQKMEPTMIHYDNQSCIKLSENLVFHDRSKLIEIRYHHLKDCVQKGIVKLPYHSNIGANSKYLDQGIGKK
eukprot:PITA_14698